MENLNTELFTFINANAGLHGWQLLSAIIVAKYIVYLIPLWLGVLWLFGARQYRPTLIFAVIAAVVALIIAHLIRMYWFHPRPFMVGLGHTFMVHAPDSSFPSNHVTFMWAIGFSLLLEAGLRKAGTIMLLLAVAVGWARIFLGIHYPFDIFGAIILASIVVILLSPIKSPINRYFAPSKKRKKFSESIAKKI